MNMLSLFVFPFICKGKGEGDSSYYSLLIHTPNNEAAEIAEIVGPFSDESELLYNTWLEINFWISSGIIKKSKGDLLRLSFSPPTDYSLHCALFFDLPIAEILPLETQNLADMRDAVSGLLAA
ncbi:MAG: hypothetical protein RLY57_404 [Candidatus Parcubacteria bacterium]|jgi:hypothetical protein